MEAEKRNLRVLLVEDNPAEVRLAEEAFAETGIPHEIRVARNGEEAMAILRRERPFAREKAPDFILLDLNLPGKDGLEVLKDRLH